MNNLIRLLSKRLFQVLLLLCLIGNVHAQPTSGSSVDPALQFNQITRDKFSNTYSLIGAFKVTGNPNLYGGDNEGVWYLKNKPATNGTISYNTYNQQAVLQLAGTTESLLQDIQTLDSFTLNVSSGVFNGNMDFLNASLWSEKDKFFVQRISKSDTYTLYKRFYSELAIVSTNYVQSELREFELKYDYYYIENGTTQLTKLKLSANGLKSAFPSKKDCWNSLDFTLLNTNKEKLLKDFFEKISNCK